MRAKIGFYREERWVTFRAEAIETSVSIVDLEGHPVSDEWIAALPTAKGPAGPFTITEDPQAWLRAMARARYSTFGVKIEDSTA